MAVVLAACGEASTPGITPTTGSTTQSVSNTTSASSGQAGVTVAIPPTNSTPGGMLITPALSPVTNGSATIPTVNNSTPIQIDQDLLAATIRLIPGSSNPTIQILSSSDTSETLADNVDKSFLAAGYKFVFPGISKPTKEGNTILGLYSKSGQADILISVADVPGDITLVNQTLGLPNLSKTSAQKFLDQVKGKKSVAFLLASANLMQNMSSTAGETPPASLTSSTTVAAVAGTPATPSVGEQDIPVYPGSTKSANGSVSLGDTTSISYVSSDDYAKITAWAKQAYTDKGWDGVVTNEQGGATTLTGRKGKYSLVTTILGPKSRENSGLDFYFKQANAGPNDTVIVVVITS